MHMARYTTNLWCSDAARASILYKQPVGEPDARKRADRPSLVYFQLP
jgi:hypothetical protein